MASKTADLSKLKNIVREVLDASHDFKNQFPRDFPQSILSFKQARSPSFADFSTLDKFGGPREFSR